MAPKYGKMRYSGTGRYIGLSTFIRILLQGPLMLLLGSIVFPLFRHTLVSIVQKHLEKSFIALMIFDMLN